MDPLSHQYHVHDVGRILLQAQAELRDIREQINPQAGVDTSAIDDVLQRAEADLRAKAEVRWRPRLLGKRLSKRCRLFSLVL